MKAADGLGTVDDGAPPDGSRQLSVIGTGRFLAPPTRVEVDAVVVCESTGPEVAWNQAAERMDRLTRQLETAGLRHEDMQAVASDLRRTDGGYRLEQRLRLTVRDLRLVAPVLANALLAGAQRVEGARFAPDDARAAGDRARERALLDAQDKAQVLAQELRLRLGPVQGVTELEGGATAQAFLLQSPPEALEAVCVLRVSYLLLD